MPPGVVVVQRSRRRPFGVLRAAPAWLRAILADRRDASPSPLPPGPDSGGLARRPRLVLDVQEAHRCTGCGVCELACPSRCLDVAGEAGRATRVRLEEGACIGCGRCVELCPEGALIAVTASAIRVPTASGEIEALDLLAEPRGAGGVGA